MGVRVDYKNAKTINDIDYIYITGGGYIDYPFRGISRDSAMGWEEPVWGDLQRSTGNFALSNIDDVDFGLVARCEISFKYMNYEDLYALRRIAKQRVCTVNYFNRDTGERETQEMAFTGADLEKIYAFDSKYLGALNVSIKLVATNRDKVNIISANHTISYNSNGGSGSIDSQTRRWSETLQLSDGSGFTKSGYIYTDATNTWVSHTDNNRISSGMLCWTDGTNVYYSDNSTQLVLDLNSLTWSNKNWNGLTSFDGNKVWNDGTNIYYSSGSDQYVLDKETSTWSAVTWTGLTNFDGSYIWSYKNNVYYSSGSQQYVLDKNNLNWNIKNWNGLTSFYRNDIWTDGNNAYHSYATYQYVLDEPTSTWVVKNWNGLTSFDASYIWSYGDNIYFSYPTSSYNYNQYILNKETSTWEVITWNGLTGFYGEDIFSCPFIFLYAHNSNTWYVADRQEVSLSLDTWNTKANGKGWSYYPNQQITVFEDMTLYAQWK